MQQVLRADFERMLERAGSYVKDPRAGLYGPDTCTWHISREAAISLGGGCAALLQVAHPFVANAVEQHSNVFSDMQGRFRRTLGTVTAMVFGDWPTVQKASRGIFALHSTVKGSLQEGGGRYHQGDEYEANTLSALYWVHATLIHTSIVLYERLFEPLSPERKEEFYQESKRFDYLFGIPDDARPRDWPAFESYWNSMIESDALCVGGPAKRIAKAISTAPNPLAEPGFAMLRLHTAALLPPRFREAYGFEFGRPEELLVEASTIALKKTLKILPDRLRCFPAYADALRRLRGEDGPDPVAGALSRAVVFSMGSWKRGARIGV